MDSELPRRLARYRPGRLARNTAWGTAAFGLRMIAQTGYFLILARMLVPAQFGTFTGLMVLAAFLATASGLGFSVILIKTLSHDPTQAPRAVAQAMAMVFWTGVVLAVAFILAAGNVMQGNLPVSLLAALAVSEIILSPWLTVVASAYQAEERLGTATWVTASLWLGRVSVAGILWLLTHCDLTTLVFAHLGVTLIVCAAWGWVATKRFHPRFPAQWPAPAQLGEGLTYSASGTASLGFTELNQTLVLSLAGPTPTAILSLSYKAIVASAAPMSMLLQATTPRLFRAAKESKHFAGRVLAGLAVPVIAYSLLCFAVLWIVAPVVPWLLGADYASTVPTIRALAILPLASGLRTMASSFLTTTGHQLHRVIVETSCMAMGLVTNFLLIRANGLSGAIAGSLVVEAFTAFALVATALWIKGVAPPGGGQNYAQ